MGADSGHTQEPQPGNDRAAPDWTAKVRTGNRSWIIVAQAKQIGEPRQVRATALELDRYLAGLPTKSPRYGIILVSFHFGAVSPICEESGLGYADLAGNARISFDNVFIETRSADNPFRERKEVRSLFAPRACRVLRVLLQGPICSWKVVELARASDVSTGWVSTVRQQLIAREWATAGPDGLRVLNPSAILDAWAAVDRWEARTDIQEYSLLLTEPSEVAKSLSDFLGDRRHAFTQWSTGWLRHPYTVPQIVTAYVDDFPEQRAVEEQLLARRVEEGGRSLVGQAQRSGGVLAFSIGSRIYVSK